MSPPVRVLLADNHRLLHPGIRTILSGIDDMVLIDAVARGSQLLSLCREHHPDVVLLADNVVDRPGGVLDQLLAQHPTVKVLLLLDSYKEVALSSLAQRGIAGALLKSDTPDRLVAAIRAIVQGRTWFSPTLSAALVAAPESEGTGDLTARDMQILRLVVAEKTDKEIGCTLGIAERTVRYHLQRLYTKLGVATRAGAAAEAVRHNLA